jgi:LPXTG-site transpeptidase (sortase) family protein
MTANNKPQDDNTELPLPGEARHDDAHKSPQKEDPAVEVVRRRVDDAFEYEPSAEQEVANVKHDHAKSQSSRHKQFIASLINSGKPMHEIQTAWHEYYAGLPDSQKHEVWNEFYKTHDAPRQPAHEAPEPKRTRRTRDVVPKNLEARKKARELANHLSSTKNRVLTRTPRRAPTGPWQYVRSLLFGLSMGCLALFIVLFSFFNERFIAPFIQPSRNLSDTPIIVEGAPLSADPEVIIPKINVEVPVVYGVTSVADSDVQGALENGVLHYADTADPGQNGNVVIVGHSAVNVFNAGKYKFAFILLHKLDVGDTFYLQKDGKRFTYQVYDKEVVKPTDVAVLNPKPGRPATATLITCDPPGYNANRMVVIGQQIDPDPSSNLAAAAGTGTVASESSVVPGNSQTLWSRLTSWL